MKKLVVFTLLCTFSYLASAIPPPDNSSSDSVKVVDSIEVVLSDFDDVGLAMVWNANGAETVAQATWSSGSHGYDSEEISRYLTKGRNYVIFALYNKVYDGGIFFQGGKYSGRMRISKNGSSYWQTYEYERDNSRGLKYWKVIVADVSSSGRVSLSESPPQKELNMLRTAMSELEDSLDRGAGVARPF